jgi:hypothetical protein
MLPEDWHYSIVFNAWGWTQKIAELRPAGQMGTSFDFAQDRSAPTWVVVVLNFLSYGI